jgi:hypothetical protein
VSFAGKTDEALALRYFANAPRNALGLGPLYNTKAAAIQAEEQYKQESAFPGSAQIGWTHDEALYDPAIRPNSFRLKRSLAAEYKRKQLRFQEP